MNRPLRRGPWGHRLLVLLFAAAVSLLTFWLIGYVVRDIDSIEGPNAQAMYDVQLPAQLLEQSIKVQGQLGEKRREIEQERTRRESLRASIEGSQQTINQLLELQQLSLEKEAALPEEQQAAMAENLQLFLEKQRQNQQLNEAITVLESDVILLQQQQRAVDSQLDTAREPIHRQYLRELRAHRWKLAAIKLGVLIPFLLIVCVIYLRSGGGVYGPLVNAVGVALAARVLLVLNDHFPAPLFRYLLIATALLITAFILIRLLRAIAFPKREWLIKQYREAYATFVCPVCEFPIRRGPLKFTYWTKRSLRKAFKPSSVSDASAGDTPYTCPCCATQLFETCEKCGATRHSLLPSCDKCGVRKPIGEESSATQDPLPSAAD